MSRIGDLEDRIERAWWRLHDVTSRVRNARQQTRERWIQLSAGVATDTTDPDYIPPDGPPIGGDETWYFKVVKPDGTTPLPGFAYQVRAGALSSWSAGGLASGGAFVATGTTNSDGIGSFVVPAGGGSYTIEPNGLTWVIGGGIGANITRAAQGGLWLTTAVSTPLSTVATSGDRPHAYWQSSPGRVLWVTGSTVTDRWGTWNLQEGFYHTIFSDYDTADEMYMYARSTGSGTVARLNGTVTTGDFYIYYFISQSDLNSGQLHLYGCLATHDVDTVDGTIPYPLKSTETQPSLDDLPFFNPHQSKTKSIVSYSHPVSLTFAFTDSGSTPDFKTLAYQGGSADVTWTEG